MKSIIKVEKILMEAINKIKPNYFIRGERDFTYELYHEIRKFNLPEKIEISAETSKTNNRLPFKMVKDLFLYKYFYDKENIDLNEKTYRRVPDLLFHEYDNKNQQYIAIEVKGANTNHTKICIDLAKLAFYCRGDLRYQKGVSILYGDKRLNNIEVPNIREFLKRYPEIEIWVKPSQKDLVIYCSNNLP